MYRAAAFRAPAHRKMSKYLRRVDEWVKKYMTDLSDVSICYSYNYYYITSN